MRLGTAPWATGLATVMEAVLTGVGGMLLVYSLLSVLCLSSLRGVRSCCCRDGLASRFWAVHVELVFTCCLGPVQNE